MDLFQVGQGVAVVLEEFGSAPAAALRRNSGKLVLTSPGPP